MTEPTRTPTQSVVMFVFLMITIFSYKENNNSVEKADFNTFLEDASYNEVALKKNMYRSKLRPVFFPIYKLVKSPEPVYELVSNQKIDKDSDQSN